MKNIFKYLAMTAVAIMTMGLVACDGNKEEETLTDLYAFQFDGRTVEDGATVYFKPTQEQLASEVVPVEFYMENKTSANLETVMKVELVSGPSALNDLTICFGETCKNGTCPWTSDAFTLVPGVNTDMRVVIDYAPRSIRGTTSVYRITIGKGTAMESPRVMLLDITGA